MVKKVTKGKPLDSKQLPQRTELGSAFVRIAHKIRSSNSEGQLIKIDGKYFRVKELG